jgi:hypothetical protein
MKREIFCQKLASVPWEQLEHAGGNASDYPSLLLEIIDHETIIETPESVRTVKWYYPFPLQAMGFLAMTLVQNKTIYSATLAIVPFLWEIFDRPKCIDRRSIAILLGEIAARQGTLIERHLDGLASQVRDAMGSRVLDLFQFLHNPSVATALSHYPEFSFEIRPSLEEASQMESFEKISYSAALARIIDPSEARKVALEGLIDECTVRSGFVTGSFSHPDEAGKHFGMNELGTKWIPISKDEAFRSLVFLLQCDLAYRSTRIYVLNSIEIAEEFLSRFADSSAHYFSNATWKSTQTNVSTSSEMGYPAFDISTFEGGVLALDSSLAGMIWVFDED